MLEKRNFEDYGYSLIPNAVDKELIIDIQNELLEVSAGLDPLKIFNDVNDMWNHHRKNNRDKAGAIYNAFKHLQSVKKLAMSAQIEKILKEELSMLKPVIIDINCRIDSAGEEKFLFDWHQDYWFSVCSPDAVVLWIPIVELAPDIGGLEIIDNKQTNGRIFKSKKGSANYNSYADAVILNDSLEEFKPLSIRSMSIGDLLCFKFNVLHKSLPITLNAKSRFTVQIRCADLMDCDFINNKYKPGVVNKETQDYLSRKLK